MEPTLASAEEMDEIVDLRRRPPGEKPAMRVTAEDLRGSGILKVLPEFMAQIARSGGASAGQGSASRPSGLPTDPANTGDDDDDPQFELDEEQAQGRTHVEMEIVAGILEERGQDDGDDQEDFELAIPPAGTAPSTTATTTDTATAKAPPMIRPLSSSDSETSSDDESSLPILQRNFDVGNGPKTAAAHPYFAAGRAARSRSHCVSISMPTPPTSLDSNELLSSTVDTATSRPRQKPILEDSETSSSGTSSEEDEGDEDEEEEEENDDDDDDDDDDGEEGRDGDADGREGIDECLPVPAPTPGPSPAGRIDAQPDAHPDGPRKRSCTETSLARDGGVQSRSDRKRVRPLIEEIE